MTVLVWDQVGDRRYELGIDRGVLYPPIGGAVVWNGLTSITETRSREIKSQYLDGIKYQDHSIPGVYSAKIQAFTYPDELDYLIGNSDFAPGVTVYDQQAQVFHLSYRSSIANDILGMDYGYKLHLIYNVTASPSDVTFDTVGASATAKSFEWNLTAVPAHIAGIRPTSHISLDSRFLDSEILATLETMLYGTTDTEPNFPTLSALFALVSP